MASAPGPAPAPTVPLPELLAWYSNVRARCLPRSLRGEGGASSSTHVNLYHRHIEAYHMEESEVAGLLDRFRTQQATPKAARQIRHILREVVTPSFTEFTLQKLDNESDLQAANKASYIPPLSLLC